MVMKASSQHKKEIRTENHCTAGSRYKPLMKIYRAYWGKIKEDIE